MTTDAIEPNTIKTLTRIQRRVLGTLIEKGLTTPDQYPLTLKSVTTGCNQKSNRDPMTDFSEDQVAATLDELREMKLVAEVFTDGGRTPRYRHYTRHLFEFNEAQLAVMAELWLRGRQQPGELRTRASRMHRIDSQEQLRTELQALFDMGYVQSTGPLDRRGVEVDHTLYLPGERRELQYTAAGEPGGDDSPPVKSAAPDPAPRHSGNAAAQDSQLAALTERIESLTDTVEQLTGRMARLEKELGL